MRQLAHAIPDRPANWPLKDLLPHYPRLLAFELAVTTPSLNGLPCRRLHPQGSAAPQPLPPAPLQACCCDMGSPLPADCIPKDLLPHYQRLLASQPPRRLNPRQILEAGVLRNRLAEATSFLESLAIKDAAEKVSMCGCGGSNVNSKRHIQLPGKPGDQGAIEKACLETVVV